MLRKDPRPTEPYLEGSAARFYPLVPGPALPAAVNTAPPSAGRALRMRGTHHRVGEVGRGESIAKCYGGGGCLDGTTESCRGEGGEEGWLAECRLGLYRGPVYVRSRQSDRS